MRSIRNCCGTGLGAGISRRWRSCRPRGRAVRDDDRSRHLCRLAVGDDPHRRRSVATRACIRVGTSSSRGPIGSRPQRRTQHRRVASFWSLDCRGPVTAVAIVDVPHVQARSRHQRPSCHQLDDALQDRRRICDHAARSRRRSCAPVRARSVSSLQRHRPQPGSARRFRRGAARARRPGGPTSPWSRSRAALSIWSRSPMAKVIASATSAIIST